MSSSPSLTAAEPASASWGDLLRGRNGLRSIALACLLYTSPSPRDS